MDLETFLSVVSCSALSTLGAGGGSPGHLLQCVPDVQHSILTQTRWSILFSQVVHECFYILHLYNTLVVQCALLCGHAFLVG